MRTLPTLLAIPIIAAACTGGAAASPSPTVAPSAVAPSAVASPAARYDVGTNPNQLVLRIATSGGFIGPSVDLTRLPLFALYADGRLIVPGTTDASFPGPLLPAVIQVQVTPAEIQKILAAADSAGLLGPDASYRNPSVADAGTTDFTTTVGGKTHRISAYALGIGRSATGADAAALQALADFAARVQDLATFLGRPVAMDQLYQPAAINIFASAAQSADPSSPAPAVIAWPLTLDPATAGQPAPVEGMRCIAIRGSDLASFLAVAATARSNAIWTAPSGRYFLSVRPLYPEESGCVNSAA